MSAQRDSQAPDHESQSAASPSTNTAESSLHNLWSAFARSVRDNAIAEVAVQVLRFGGLLVLARALSPDDFGVFRVLMVTSVFAMLVNESGIPDALIQRRILTPTHESTAWCLSIVLVSISTAAMYLAAPLIAGAMQMPRLVLEMRLLCIPIMLEGTAVTANARLRRKLRFGALAVADVVGELGFLVVAICTLLLGHPRMSLAAGLGARFVFHAVAIWIADPYYPATMPRISAARDFARFSSTVVGSRIIFTFSSNADFLLVGRMLGSSALGFYSMAWDLLRFIPDRLYKVAGRVTLPAFCRLQDDNPRLSRAYQEFIRYIAQIILPIVICASIAAPSLIAFVYGAKWVPAALQMRLLAPGLILMGLRCGIGSVYFTKDHPSFDLYLHGARLFLILIVVTATAPMGLPAVSIGMSIIEGAISIAAQWLVCWLIELEITKLAATVKPAVSLAIWCAAATVVGKAVGEWLDSRGVALIALESIPAALVFIWFGAALFSDVLNIASGRKALVNFTEGPA